MMGPLDLFLLSTVRNLVNYGAWQCVISELNTNCSVGVEHFLILVFISSLKKDVHFNISNLNMDNNTSIGALMFVCTSPFISLQG